MELILGYASQADFRMTLQFEGIFQSRRTVVEPVAIRMGTLAENVLSSD
jgi:hypothetical protein